MGFIKCIMQCVHNWFRIEAVSMPLCTISQRLHLGADDVGSMCPRFFELFPDVVKAY